MIAGLVAALGGSRLIRALPAGSALAGLLSDYAVMRDQARACAAR